MSKVFRAEELQIFILATIDTATAEFILPVCNLSIRSTAKFYLPPPFLREARALEFLNNAPKIHVS